MAMHSVDTLFRLVPDGSYFVGLDIFGNYISSNFYLVDKWCTHRYGITINYQQSVEASLPLVGFYQLNVERLALRDEILFAAGLDYCFFHLEKLP